MVFDFFKSLGQSRVQGVKGKAKGKAMSAKSKAKSKAASAVDKPADKAKQKAKQKAKGGGEKGEKAAAKKKKEGGGVGKKKKKKAAEEPEEDEDEQPEAEFGEKTQFIQVEPERPKECVGWVVALSGPLKGQDFRLVTGKNIVGTAADCDVVLTDQYMSSRHAVIRHEEDTFVLVDLDSTNGSFVNETRISKEELVDNDRVRLGRTELKFKSLY